MFSIPVQNYNIKKPGTSLQRELQRFFERLNSCNPLINSKLRTIRKICDIDALFRCITEKTGCCAHCKA